MKREMLPIEAPGYCNERLISEFLRNEDGATAIEYVIIASMIFIAIVASVKAFSGNTSGMYTNIAETLEEG